MSKHNAKESLLERIAAREALIGVVGLGYVGIPLALRFLEGGFPVLGFDTDPAKVTQLNNGESYIGHIPSELIGRFVDQERFTATSDFSRSGEPDALIICVPTPLNRHREPDLSFVEATVESIAPRLRSGQLVSLESTTYPGTTEEIVVPRLERAGLEVGTEVFVVYAPEREDPGNAEHDTGSIPRVCGGITESCREVGVSLYSSVIQQVVPVSSTRAAELTKLLENIFRAVNIGLVNEMKMVADRMGIDLREVIEAAATKPFGYMPFYPGPGLGGHCIPIDPFYLTWKAREYGVNTRFIELAGEINTAMPEWVVAKVADALNARGKPVRGSRVLVLGVAYKPNVDDLRESPSLRLIDLLDRKGALVGYSDPHVPHIPRLRRYRFDLRSEELIEETIRAQDCLLLATDHDGFDYDLIGQHASLIVDTRGAWREPMPNLVRA